MSASKKSSLELYRLRKTLDTLARKEGSHTELITMYVPPGKPISDAITRIQRITEENVNVSVEMDMAEATLRDKAEGLQAELKKFRF